MSQANIIAVEYLIKKASNGFPNEKLAAIEALGNAGGEKAVNFLITIAEQGFPNEKLAALSALGYAGNIK